MSWKPLSAQKNKFWLWTAVNHFEPGILAWVLGDHSAKTFAPLWEYRWSLALLFLRHRRLACLSDVYPGWRPNYFQDQG